MGRDHCPFGKFRTRRLAVKNCKGEDDFIILARTYYVENRLVDLTDGSAYCRESDRSRPLSNPEKEEIKINKGERAFELEPSTLQYPDDFDIKLIRRFTSMIRASREGSEAISDERVLESLRMGKLRNGVFFPNNVCVLAFASDPRHAFPGAYVHYLRYNGTEAKSGKEYNVIKDRVIDGNISKIIQDTSALIDANIGEFTTFINGKFYQRPEYPHDAWYELIVNACVHRSYHAKTQPIFIKMFDDHLVVESPGGFMPSVTPENLFHKPRNTFLMFYLRESGEVRCIGEGTQRIKRELEDAALPPAHFREDQGCIKVTLRNDIANRTNSLDSQAYKILGEALAFSLDADEKRIVNYVVENGSINASQALRILSTTYWHTARAKLQRLNDRKILDFVSKKQRDPKAHYILHKEKPKSLGTRSPRSGK